MFYVFACHSGAGRNPEDLKLYVHFFVRHKGPWLSGFSLTQQPKRVALSLKGLKKSRPGVSRPD